MKRIIKREAPGFWQDYRMKHPKAVYYQAGPEIRTRIREHMLVEQQYVCPYCCRQIGSTGSHNEHIKPESGYPQYSMDYRNIVACCTISETCGMKKGNMYDESLFVSPLDEDCEKHFSFSEDGGIIACDAAGRYTIDLLNLNEYSLKNARKALLEEMKAASCCGMDFLMTYYVNAKDGKLPRFVDMAQYFMDLQYFEDEVPDGER